MSVEINRTKWMLVQEEMYPDARLSSRPEGPADVYFNLCKELIPEGGPELNKLLSRTFNDDATNNAIDGLVSLVSKVRTQRERIETFSSGIDSGIIS